MTNDLEAQSGVGSFDGLRGLASIGGVCIGLLGPKHLDHGFFDNGCRDVAFLDAGRGDVHRDQKAQGIHHPMASALSDVLACVEA